MDLTYSSMPLKLPENLELEFIKRHPLPSQVPENLALIKRLLVVMGILAIIRMLLQDSFWGVLSDLMVAVAGIFLLRSDGQESNGLLGGGLQCIVPLGVMA